MKLLSIAAQLEAETGVNPMFSYCAITGKPYARILDDDFIAAFERFVDRDECKDEMLTATLAAMRPCPSVASLTPEAIDSLRHRRPRMLLAYLLGRYLTPRDHSSLNGLKIPFTARLKLYRERINFWKVIHASKIDDLRLNQLLLVLLQFDSRFNLNEVAPVEGVSYYTFVASQTIESLDAFMGLIVNHLDYLTEKREMDFKQAKLSAEYWARGSGLTRKATLSQFLSVTPPSPTRAKIVAKRKKDDDFLDALEQLIGDSNKEPEASPRPITPLKVKNFIPAGGLRLKLNLAKKES